MQQITPIEIRQKSFGKSFRGYNTDEVEAFLHSLAHAWEKLIVQFNEISDTLERSSKEIKRLQGVENAIVKALNESKKTAQNIIEKATKDADLKVRETELEVEKILRNAHEKAKNIEKEHAQKYQSTKEKMTEKLETTTKVVQEIEIYRDALLQKLQSLAEDILSKRRMIEGSISAKPLFDEEPKKDTQGIRPYKSFQTTSSNLGDVSHETTSAQPRRDIGYKRPLTTRAEPIRVQ